jgi:uncharacterized protein (DUF1684 family)
MTTRTSLTLGLIIIILALSKIVSVAGEQAELAGVSDKPSYTIDLKWRLEAKFEAYNPPKIVPIVNVLGMVDNMTSPGALVFDVDGKTYRLDPVLEKGSTQLFIIFADNSR